ncbi:hypothetical protein PR048_013370 [Dryococelus australis]|uniref:Uncharacterized protein n=1 Tax=Dryococelus australis TaxID=614101 RepID=A0ABQ9HSS5_9NEOP|nr:hypothetical protein PR048_013370 [Dryococelus australis]
MTLLLGAPQSHSLHNFRDLNSSPRYHISRLLTAWSLEPMRVIEVSMEWRRNEGAGEKGGPEKTRRPTALSGTIPKCENFVTWPVIEPRPPWWEASRLTQREERKKNLAVNRAVCLTLSTGKVRERLVVQNLVKVMNEKTVVLQYRQLAKVYVGGIVRHVFDVGWCSMLQWSESIAIARLSSRAITWKVNRPKSTVAFILRKWKVDENCANAAHSGQPPIVVVRNCRTLKHEIVKNMAQPMATIRQKFHAATEMPTDLDISEEQLHISSISRQAIKLGDSGGIWTVVTGHWSSGNRFCGVMSRGLHFSGPMDMYGCGIYPGNGFCWCDDNARCHVSRATRQWYADNNVRQLDWSAQSPDLNPIEHLWDKLDRRMRARQALPESIAQLMKWLQEEWQRIPMDVLQTLVESMPDRVAAVVAARVRWQCNYPSCLVWASPAYEGTVKETTVAHQPLCLVYPPSAGVSLVGLLVVYLRRDENVIYIGTCEHSALFSQRSVKVSVELSNHITQPKWHNGCGSILTIDVACQGDPVLRFLGSGEPLPGANINLGCNIPIGFTDHEILLLLAIPSQGGELGLLAKRTLISKSTMVQDPEDLVNTFAKHYAEMFVQSPPNVISKFEYCSVIWNYITTTDSRRLEIEAIPVYYPSPNVSRPATQLSEEEQVKIAKRIGLIQHLPTGTYDGCKKNREPINTNPKLTILLSTKVMLEGESRVGQSKKKGKWNCVTKEDAVVALPLSVR